MIKSIKLGLVGILSLLYLNINAQVEDSKSEIEQSRKSKIQKMRKSENQKFRKSEIIKSQNKKIGE